MAVWQHVVNIVLLVGPLSCTPLLMSGTGLRLLNLLSLKRYPVRLPVHVLTLVGLLYQQAVDDSRPFALAAAEMMFRHARSSVRDAARGRRGRHFYSAKPHGAIPA